MSVKLYTDVEICGKSVDENEVLYDEKEDFIKRLHTVEIQCPEELNNEILKNLQTCRSVFLMFIKQRIIMNEPRVRYHPRNDVSGLKEKIFQSQLSKFTRSFLQDTSMLAYKVMKDFHMLETLVEFDSERPRNVVAFGKKLRMMGYADVLFLAEGPLQSNVKPREPKPETETSISECSTSHKSQQSKRKGRPSEKRNPPEKTKGLPSVACSDEERSDKADFLTNMTNRATVTVMVTARNNLGAVDIYRQLLLSYLHTLSKFYFLVLHIGPLVEKQEMVLYEYIPDQKLVELINSFDGSNLDMTGECSSICDQFIISPTVHKSNSLDPPDHQQPLHNQNDMDISELEKCFREVKGVRLQKVADLKQYFKYLVYDCPGVKDSEEDKKHRYERYMAKREQKKEKKRIMQDKREKCSECNSRQGNAGTSEGPTIRLV